ncbi:histidine kinase [Marinifilum breve]|uniref:Histidine kinase n=1 Tax=Marinifilum breve TaxID=2184082 RepID=A0A2V3ZZP6_9BACT|nr:PAS domain-containing protein [Marinifilum breve]PXY02095.1 histidine kinase [Marinifilum breve]
MKRKINYKILDGRGQTEEFKDCVLNALEEINEGEGICVIKEFEPFPLYKMMEKRGFDKHLDKIGEEEFHVWFFPKEIKKDLKMKQHLSLDDEKLQKIMDIKLQVFRGELKPEAAKKIINENFDSITPEEFAYGEQHMLNHGIDDDLMTEKMDDIIEIFSDVLVREDLNLPEGHPINTYLKEAEALDGILVKMEEQLKVKFAKNPWLVLYEKLSQINVHFSRKQNQLFSALEQKGFDRPSKVMWTFDNNVRDAIKDAFILLNDDKDQEFLKAQENVIFLVKDILLKEREILYPTSLELIPEAEFAAMRKSDDEIGYCLIDHPPVFRVENSENKTSDELSAKDDLISDLSAVLNKHGLLTSKTDDEVLDVSMGKLKLEQINLIFKHLQVDLSYVDENDIVKFYSDTKHRVFPRSAGVIGREVQNCHPRESVETVEEIIKAFREGKQDKAEFWLEIGGKFIYIIYNAVRDDEGKFRGVLEMMQDVTRIRSLTGSQKLLNWEDSPKEEVDTSHQKEASSNINPQMTIGKLLKAYPYLKEYLIKLNPMFNKLNNAIVFKTMKNVATMDMVASRAGISTHELIEKLDAEIERNK